MTSEISRERFDQIPNLLAILTTAGGYEYVDRLAYSNSKALALFYLREAARAFHALKRSPPAELPDEAKTLLDSINPEYLDLEIKIIEEKGDDTRKLREMTSYICARALAKSSKFLVVKSK
ncbi:MAG: hypothetical protein QXI52_04775 [Nitrososphaerota archaeon]